MNINNHHNISVQRSLNSNPLLKKQMNTRSKNIFKTGYVLNDKWVIIEFIGKGAMGEVYRAHQLNLKRDVAIKVISPEMLSSFDDDPEETKIAFQRFRREVQTMAGTRHANIVQIYDYGTETIITEGNDFPVEYIVMEYVPGATLRHTMSEEGFFPEQDLTQNWLEKYFIPLLDGVEAIHSRDIVHRDLKPENVLMDGNIPKIADFGIARSSRMEPVTQSIDVKGTPAYMSPEHFFDFKNADQQSDLYSLGKILYEAISGKITRETIPFKIVQLTDPDTPFFKKIDQIVQRMTAEKKEKRPKSVGEARTAILEALNLLAQESRAITPAFPRRFSFLHRPRYIWTGIAVSIVFVVAMGLWHLMGLPEKAPDTDKDLKLLIEETSLFKKQSSVAPPKTMRSKDGILMRFVAGGNFTSKKQFDKGLEGTIRVQPFYMDEKLVTNHYFLEFLNAVKETLIVKDGVVKQKDKIWFYLGHGTEPYEQIIYEQNRFLLRESAAAALPVVRVTWYGAAAYAGYYGKRLPTETEWNYAVANHYIGIEKNNTLPSEAPVIEDGTSTPKNDIHPHMNIFSPETGDMKSLTLHQDSNEKVIKGLKEWVVNANTNQKELKKNTKRDNNNFKSLIVVKDSRPGADLKSFRYPWEAFGDVGFRCTLSFKPESF